MKINSLIILSSILLISVFSFTGCNREVQDDDLITGKWIETRILLDTLSTPCEKASFVEFSEYKISIQDRIYNRFFACESIGEYEGEEGTETYTIPPYTETIGNYTIIGDTLVVKDVNNITHIYVIDTINAEKMTLETLDRNGNLEYLFYKRFQN
ncbi:MAG: hypothetical protein WCR29_00570 [Bacteroidales bacterium]